MNLADLIGLESRDKKIKNQCLTHSVLDMMRITRVKLRQRMTRLETRSSTRKRLSSEKLVWNNRD